MTGFVLKIIALTAMIVDHLGCALMFAFDTTMLRAIGRIAFPIYAFLITEGCRHTKDLKKYMLRLGVFALLSELPFDFLLINARTRGPHPLYFLGMEHQNIFFTLFLGILAIYLYESRKGWRNQKLPLKNPFWYWTTWAAIVIGWLVRVDYGSIGVFAIVMVYYCGNGISDGTAAEQKTAKKRQILALLLIIFVLYSGFSAYYLLMLLFACLSLVFIYFYNGQRGPSFKWLFYAAYPVHFSVLGLFWYFYVAPVLLNYSF